MKRILTYQVYPAIPKPLAFLEVLSRNLWWCWKQDAITLFRRVEPQLWIESRGNPIQLLSNVSQTRLEELAADDSFLDHLKRVEDRYTKRVMDNAEPSRSIYEKFGPVAYFSMEFGVNENIPIFAGGLGVLAGDYLKAASNMAMPLVGIGLLYRKGYFRQYLDQEGLQQEEYPEIEFYYLPLERARDPQGNEITISITGPQGEIYAFVWRIRVGRTSLFLLDTNLPENTPEGREITARLYVAEPKIRLAQEFLLGVGGIRALAAMGIFPSICHMNEGHSAFSALERLAMFMERYHIDLKTALQIIPRCTVFTTHTPVPAGHDSFPVDLVKPWIRLLQERLGAGEEEILSWGQPEDLGKDAPLSMSILGLRMSQYRNGVSCLHGRTARKMWAYMWSGRPEDEIPISHVTNGMHVSTFISQEIWPLFERYLGPEWYMSSRRPENINRIDEIYDDEIWRAHEMSRSRLIRTCRGLLKQQYERRNAPKSDIDKIEAVLNPDVLTIAFARRFAAYKRAHLLFQDPERLATILNNETRPVQIIFAGKAHPQDNKGKEIIKRVIEFIRRPEFRQRAVFIEGYDMALARSLVQGADVWLSTPRRPFEACGTSGMKAAINGVLNVSILDGWWCEGYSEERGWRIGGGEEYIDSAYQDDTESHALYNVLENSVIPCFYEEREGELPKRWIQMMKASIKMAMKDFCSLRMVGEYEDRYYIPIIHRLKTLLKKNGLEACNLALQEERLHNMWKDIRIGLPVQTRKGPFRVGESFEVTVEVSLGELNPEEVIVELYNGHMKAVDALEGINTIPMTVVEDLGNGNYRYGCQVPCELSGRYGFTARATPAGDDYMKNIPNLITWS
ncbi:MAG: alpha-glucan family phosphorylase [Thermodesulfobacteriota bacterium]|nr:alpha-glucan family phosphorylase [Thermodesulfobacteriota bacterium]